MLSLSKGGKHQACCAFGELGCDGKAVRHDGNCVFRRDVEPCDFVLLSRHFHLIGS